MNVVIFGGAGFVARHLINYYKSANDKIFLVDNSFEFTRWEEIETDVYAIRGDVRDQLTIEMNFNPDHVIDTAAVHRTPGHKPHEYYLTNTLGAINISNWIRTYEINCLTVLSSISVYGSNNESVCENSELLPNTDYGRSKLISERIYISAHDFEKSNYKLRIIRPAVIFGQGENGNFTRLAKSLNRRRFALFGNGDLIKSSGYVKDLVRAIDFASKTSERSANINFTFPVHYSISDIVQALCRVQSRNFPPNFDFEILNQLIKNLPSSGIKTIERAKKLSQSLIVEPKWLKSQGFEWKFSLDEACLDWYADVAGKF